MAHQPCLRMAALPCPCHRSRRASHGPFDYRFFLTLEASASCGIMTWLGAQKWELIGSEGQPHKLGRVATQLPTCSPRQERNGRNSLTSGLPNVLFAV